MKYQPVLCNKCSQPLGYKKAEIAHTGPNNQPVWIHKNCPAPVVS